MTKHCRFLLSFILFFISLSGQAQQGNYKEMAQYDSIRKSVPREKLYMQLDKPVYAMGDTIWFKGYLVNASLLNYSTTSALIYADMIDKNGQVVQTVSLPTQYGLTWAGFAINPNKYEPGSYTFRAYTNWMQNFGDTFLFKKDIQILDIAEPQPTIPVAATTKAQQAKSGTANTNKKPLIDLQFLPEGGTWIAERQQKLAFKALNINGKGIAVAGDILDSKQQKVASFKSNGMGMGYFDFTPKSDETYVAKYQSAIGNGSQPLPKTQPNGVTLRISNNLSSDSIGISILSDLPNQELTILGQSRGVLCFLAKIKPNSTYKIIRVAKNIFPTGVCQILVQNEQQQTLNERNFFINHHDELKIQMAVGAQSFTVRDSIPLHLKITDPNGKPIAGSFSLAVTDDGQVKKDSLNDQNILNYLLMSSDLKGEIENPGHYFQVSNTQQQEELEALMLTQGWVSYQWDLNKKPTFKAESEFTVSGKVTNITNKPIAKGKITLLSTKKGFMIMDTVTNDKGEFVFRNFPAMDSLSFLIQALNAKGNRGTLGITMDEFKRPTPAIAIPQIPLAAIPEATDSTIKQMTMSQRQASTYRGGGIGLREVKITGKKVVKRSKNLNGPGEADQTFSESDLEKLNKKSLLNVLEENVKGFRMGYKRKTNIKEFMVNFAIVKLVIDGVDVDFFYSPSDWPITDAHYQHLKYYLDYYTAEDLQGIEIMKHARNAGRYRMEFLNPMDETEYAFIEITTKTGSGPFLKKAANMYIYKPLPYGDNKIFYSPKYTSANKANKTPDVRSTLYWAPNIVTNKNGEANTYFFASDRKGTYTAWLEGTDTEGNFGFQSIKITVK